MTDVRVGIVTWNTAECLERCLEALPAALGGLAAELVVVDNASSDGSADVAQRFPGVRVVRNTENVGYARAMNQALHGTSAPFLLALNPDTEPSPDSLAELVEFLRSNPDVGLVAPRLLNADGTLQHSVHRFPSIALATVVGFVPLPLRPGRIGEGWWLEGSADALHEHTVDVDWVIGAVHCIRAAALDGASAYSERWFMYVEDLNLCWQLHKRGWRITLLGETAVTHLGNVAGERAWGAAREQRWLDAMYDWYTIERGAVRARMWAAVNLVAMVTKFAVVLALLWLRRSSAELREKAEGQRALVGLHSRKLRSGTSLPREAMPRPEPVDPLQPRLLAISPTGLLSGAEIVLLRDLDAARAAGWAVRCACPDGPLVDRLSRIGVERVRLADLKVGGGVRVVALLRALVRSARAARRIRRDSRDSDVVLVNGLNALVALRLARVRVPRVWLAHDVIVRADRLLFLRLGAPAVDLAIAVSEAVAQPLRQAHVPTAVVYNGAPWPTAPALHDAQRLVVGCAAALTPWKGHDVLLEAVARLRRADVALELVGAPMPKDEKYAAALRDRAAQPDLAGRVHFVGHVDDPIARMRSWRVAVSASVDPEAGPLTALEAMASGVPVVATAHGGVVEVLGDAGLLVPPGDADALAHALGRLLDDPNLHRRCAQAGPRLVVGQDLTIEAHQRGVLHLLDEILGATGTRRSATPSNDTTPLARSA